VSNQLKKYSFLLMMLSLFFTCVFSQTFDSLFQRGLQLEQSFNEKQALIKFQEAHKLNPNHLQVLYKCSDLCSRIGAREKNEKIKLDYFNSALFFAKKAYRISPDSDEANVEMSVAQGRIALTNSGEDKIILVKEIKLFADKAIQINPNNFKAWHILGKWHFEISNLNFFEKAAIKLFYGGLPESSFKISIKAYEKAKSINSKFCLNYLELAKAYEKNDDINQAITNLKLLLQLPNSIEDDFAIKQEASKLLKKWQ
jgi:tetratricopeptide (TPR) repeat protein